MSDDESLERQSLFQESPRESKLTNFLSKFLSCGKYSRLDKQEKSHSIVWGIIAAIIIGLLIGDLIVRLAPRQLPVLELDDYNNAPIILLGDSITEYGYSTDRGGWSSLMSCAYALRYDVLNRYSCCFNPRGHWGHNTNAFVNKIQPIIKKALGNWESPSLVTLMIGTK